MPSPHRLARHSPALHTRPSPQAVPSPAPLQAALGPASSSPAGPSQPATATDTPKQSTSTIGFIVPPDPGAARRRAGAPSRIPRSEPEVGGGVSPAERAWGPLVSGRHQNTTRSAIDPALPARLRSLRDDCDALARRLASLPRDPELNAAHYEDVWRRAPTSPTDAARFGIAAQPWPG